MFDKLLACPPREPAPRTPARLPVVPGGHGRSGRSGFADVRTIGAVAIAVTEYCPAELATALRIHPLTAQRLMADAVDLHDRMPATWKGTQDLVVEDWAGRKIAALATTSTTRLRVRSTPRSRAGSACRRPDCSP